MGRMREGLSLPRWRVRKRRQEAAVGASVALLRREMSVMNVSATLRLLMPSSSSSS